MLGRSTPRYGAEPRPLMDGVPRGKRYSAAHTKVPGHAKSAHAFHEDAEAAPPLFHFHDAFCFLTQF